MKFDPVTGWGVSILADFAVPASGLVWDEGKWDEKNWNITGGTSYWVELDCQTLTANLRVGASRTNGVLTRYESSTLDVELWDPERNLDPYSSTGYAQLGSMRVRSGFAMLARHQSAPTTDVWLFTGFVESMEYNYDEGTARIVAADAVSYLARYDPEDAVPPVGDGDTAAQRITRILDNAQWPADQRRITAGGTLLTATKLGGTAWDEMLTTVDADLGLLWVSPDGYVTFIPRQALPWEQTVSVNVGNGSQIPLVSTIAQVDDAGIANQVSVTREGSPTVFAKADATSAALHGYAGRPVYYAISRRDLPVKTDTDAQNWAASVLHVNAYRDPRLSPLMLQLTHSGALLSDPVAWKGVAGVQIGDRWAVRCDPLEIEEEQHVRGWSMHIGHDGASLTWQAAVVTTSATWATPMTWDDPKRGFWDEFTWA